MSRRMVLTTLLGLVGVLSVAVFVGAFEPRPPIVGGADGVGATPAGALFRGVLYPVLAALVLVLLIGLVREVRRRSGAAPGHRRLELIWTAIPVAALVAVAVGERELRAAEPPTRAAVVASRVGWTGADLEATAGTSLELELSASDEVHVLVSPALGLELSARPGHPARARVEVPEAGAFELSCALHGQSVGRLHVLPAR